MTIRPYDRQTLLLHSDTEKLGGILLENSLVTGTIRQTESDAKHCSNNGKITNMVKTNSPALRDGLFGEMEFYAH